MQGAYRAEPDGKDKISGQEAVFLNRTPAFFRSKRHVLYGRKMNHIRNNIRIPFIKGRKKAEKQKN